MHPATPRRARRIAERPRRDAFVEAAAGTGKTTALVGRIVALLRSGRATLERIVARDLHREGGRRDEAAAARARSSRRAPHAADDGAERARLDGGARRSSRSRASARSTRSAPTCCASGRSRRGVDPLFEVAAEDETRRAARPGVRRTGSRRRSPTRRRACAGVLRRRAARARRARRRASAATARRARWSSTATSPPRGAATPFDRDARDRRAARAARARSARSRRARRRPERLARAEPRERRALRRRERGSARRCAGATTTVSRPSCASSRARKDGWRWHGAASRATSRPRPARDEVLAQRDARRRRSSTRCSTTATPISRRCLQRGAPAASSTRYEELKQRAGMLDFLDLLVRARDLRARPRAGARRARSARFTHFFVDEFQDTDPLPGRDPAAARGRRSRRRRDWRAARAGAGQAVRGRRPEAVDLPLPPRRRRALRAIKRRLARARRGAACYLTRELPRRRRDPGGGERRVRAVHAAAATTQPGRLRARSSRGARTTSPGSRAVVALPVPRPY